jgi:hypothetical protein
MPDPSCRKALLMRPFKCVLDRFKLRKFEAIFFSFQIDNPPSSWGLPQNLNSTVRAGGYQFVDVTLPRYVAVAHEHHSGV